MDIFAARCPTDRLKPVRDLETCHNSVLLRETPSNDSRRVFMKFPVLLALLPLAALLTSCAWTPQRVTIAPEIQVPASNVGHGAAVIVRVIDVRPSSRIGFRGLDSEGAEITTEQNLTQVFQQKIIEGLRLQGFKAAAFSEEPARGLKVEIRAVQYTTDMDFMKGIIRVKASLQAQINTEASAYDKGYVAERQETAAEAPRAKTNARMINGAVADVLRKLLEDEKLVRMLAN